jgi:hypothetical protein
MRSHGRRLISFLVCFYFCATAFDRTWETATIKAHGNPAGAAAGFAPGEAPKGQLVRDWRVVAKCLAPLAAVWIFLLVVYLAARRENEDLDRAGEARLWAGRDRLLGALAGAMREADSGSRALRRQAELTRRLAQVYRILDERAAQRALEAPAAASPKRFP